MRRRLGKWTDGVGPGHKRSRRRGRRSGDHVPDGAAMLQPVSGQCQCLSAASFTATRCDSLRSFARDSQADCLLSSADKTELKAGETSGLSPIEENNIFILFSVTLTVQ